MPIIKYVKCVYSLKISLSDVVAHLHGLLFNVYCKSYTVIYADNSHTYYY